MVIAMSLSKSRIVLWRQWITWLPACHHIATHLLWTEWCRLLTRKRQSDAAMSKSIQASRIRPAVNNHCHRAWNWDNGPLFIETEANHMLLRKRRNVKVQHRIARYGLLKHLATRVVKNAWDVYCSQIVLTYILIMLTWTNGPAVPPKK